MEKNISNYRAFAIASWVLLAMDVLLAISLALHVQRYTPGLEKLLSGFGMEIPALTRVVLSITKPMVLIISSTVLVVGLVAKELLVRNKAVCLVANNAVLVVLVVLFEVYREAMLRPILELIRALSE